MSEEVMVLRDALRVARSKFDQIEKAKVGEKRMAMVDMRRVALYAVNDIDDAIEASNATKIMSVFERWLCRHFGHKWKSTGGVYCQTCPDEGNDDDFFQDLPDSAYNHSTAVYECERRACGDFKYEDYPDCPHAKGQRPFCNTSKDGRTVAETNPTP